MSPRLGLITLLLATVLAAGCSGGDDTAETTTSADTGTTTVAAPSASKITLRAGRTNTGPWVESLSLEHGPDGIPTNFYVCAAWDESRAPAECDAAAGADAAGRHGPPARAAPGGSCGRKPGQPRLGNRRNLRCRRARSPAERLRLRLGRREATYRVTLRPRGGGPALATSNPITVAWPSRSGQAVGDELGRNAARPSGLRRRTERDRRAPRGRR